MHRRHMKRDLLHVFLKKINNMRMMCSWILICCSNPNGRLPYACNIVVVPGMPSFDIAYLGRPGNKNATCRLVIFHVRIFLIFLIYCFKSCTKFHRPVGNNISCTRRINGQNKIIFIRDLPRYHRSKYSNTSRYFSPQICAWVVNQFTTILNTHARTQPERY